MKINLKDLLNESPLDTFQTIGDFSKPASFSDKRDASSVTNSATLKKVKDIFKNTTVNFDLYFVNKPGLRKFTEKRKVDYKFLVTPYPNGLGLNPNDIKINDDNITVFFVGNVAAQKIPMTAWTIVHRIGHVMNNTYAFREYTSWLEKEFRELLSLYNVNYTQTYEDNTYKRKRIYDLAKGRLFNTIGTMRSARDSKLHSRYFEFYFELFVQYLKNGEIKFNPLPQNLLVGFGPYGSKTLASTKTLDHAQEKLDMIANTIPYYLEDVLGASVGEIFVM